MVDLRKLQSALLREDVKSIHRVLTQLEQCEVCEFYGRLRYCKAPDCQFRACEDCVRVHTALHAYPEDEGRTQ